jgi:hypothetical protein
MTFHVPWPEDLPENYCQIEPIRSYYARSVCRFRLERPLKDDRRFQYLHRMHVFIECRNAILNVKRNVDKMAAVSYCGQRISILVLDRTRLNVARLVPIEISSIESLALTFDVCMKGLLEIPAEDENSLHDQYRRVSSYCQGVLSSLGVNYMEIDHGNLWRYSVAILDMAVVSYVGAHVHNPLCQGQSPPMKPSVYSHMVAPWDFVDDLSGV